MTFQNVRLKIASPALKLKTALRLPASLLGANFVTVTPSGQAYVISADYTKLDPTAIIDPSATLMAIYDANTTTYKAASLSTLISQAGQIMQQITAAGPAAISNNAGIVIVNQAAGAAITLNLPAAASKTCPVLIADWKGDAGTNNITIVPNGAEKIQGKAQWTIAGDTGSVFLRPIAGMGYVI